MPVVGASAAQLLPVPPPVQAEEVEGLEQGTDHVPAEHVPGEHTNSRSYVYIYIYLDIYICMYTLSAYIYICMAQVGSSWLKLVQVGSSWFKLVQVGSELTFLALS